MIASTPLPFASQCLHGSQRVWRACSCQVGGRFHTAQIIPTPNSACNFHQFQLSRHTQELCRAVMKKGSGTDAGGKDTGKPDKDLMFHVIDCKQGFHTLPDKMCPVSCQHLCLGCPTHALLTHIIILKPMPPSCNYFHYPLYAGWKSTVCIGMADYIRMCGFDIQDELSLLCYQSHSSPPGQTTFSSWCFTM